MGRGMLRFCQGLLVAGLVVPGGIGTAAEIVIFGFEGSAEGWEVPDWAMASADYVGKDLRVSDAQAHDGTHALALDVSFPGDRWTGGYIEHLLEVKDWTLFGQLSVRVYLPPDAPTGLKGRIILTMGEQWRWTEMNRGIPLAPGQWTTLTANLKPGSMDWSFFPDEQFRKDVRKMGVRIESNATPYTGSVWFDDFRLAE